MYTRITNQTLLRGYRREYNRILRQKNNLERKITSTRDFNRASEAPLKAAKALNVRKSLYYSAQYRENLKTANKFYTEGETSLLQVSDKLANIRETIIAACNTTKDIIDYNIYAQQLETSAQELCNIFNTDSAERVIFGGSSNDPMPLQIINDSNGNPSTVTYHGVPVNCYNDYKEFPYSDVVSLDIGIGMLTNQETHVTNPNTMLNISFNGAKVSGCGAESGTADIDLSSIVENGVYCLDVYAGNVKHTIAFRGQATPEANVDEINRQLEYAFNKDVVEYRKLDAPPRLDDQGVIAIKDKVVAVVNNTIKDATKVTLAPGTAYTIPVNRVRQLGVDNDAGYTNKYKVNLSNLKEGQEYSLKVTVGDVTKTITFAAGKDLVNGDSIVDREDTSAANIQAALDAAFPDEKVTISKDELTKGIITCEGKAVKITAAGEPTDTDNSAQKVGITSNDAVSVLSFKGLKSGQKYVVNAFVDGAKKKIEFEAGADADASKDNFKTALEAAFSPKTFTVNDDGSVTDNVSGKTISFAKAEVNGGTQDNPYALTVKANEVDTSSLIRDKWYTVKVDGKDVTFQAKGSPQRDRAALASEVGKLTTANTGDKYIIDTDGKIKIQRADSTIDANVTVTESADAVTDSKAMIPTASSNYTIDVNSLKGGVEYSLKVVYNGQVKNITFTPDGDGDVVKLNEALKSAFGTKAGGDANVEVGADGKVTSGVELINNTAEDAEALYERHTVYSNNYIQLTLDAAKALRNGDISYANGCIDRIVKANENLLAEIADLGCNEEYIDFNIARITTREENLQERQNDLEIADPEQTITLWKQFEAMYNACLQMSSQVVPNSIFNYIK